MKVFVTKDHDTSMVSSKMMRLIPVGANQTIVAFGDDEYFFSYQTCVAGFTSGEGYWRTSEKCQLEGQAIGVVLQSVL